MLSTTHGELWSQIQKTTAGLWNRRLGANDLREVGMATARAGMRLSECLAGSRERHFKSNGGPLITTTGMLRIQRYLVYLNKRDSERRR